MKRVMLAGAALLLIAHVAAAEVTLNSVRVGAMDTVALAKFYQAAFGMHEVNRLQMQGGPEIFVNFGATADAARANRNPPVVIMYRKSDADPDPMPRVIFTVTDIAATVAAVKAAGGKIDGDPRQFGNTGIVIGFGADPAGNRFELIQPKQ